MKKSLLLLGVSCGALLLGGCVYDDGYVGGSVTYSSGGYYGDYDEYSPYYSYSGRRYYRSGSRYVYYVDRRPYYVVSLPSAAFYINPRTHRDRDYSDRYRDYRYSDRHRDNDSDRYRSQQVTTTRSTNYNDQRRTYGTTDRQRSDDNRDNNKQKNEQVKIQKSYSQPSQPQQKRDGGNKHDGGDKKSDNNKDDKKDKKDKKN